MNRKCGNCLFSDEDASSVRGSEGRTACKESGPVVFLAREGFVAAFPIMDLEALACARYSPNIPQAVHEVPDVKGLISTALAWAQDLQLRCEDCAQVVDRMVDAGESTLSCDCEIVSISPAEMIPEKWQIERT